MNRRIAAALGLAAGVLGGLLILAGMGFSACGRGGRERAPSSRGAGGEAAQPSTAALPEAQVPYRPVTIYLRAPGEALALAAVPAQIVDFPSPVERARQIARLVLDGVPETRDAVAPVRRGVTLREALIDDRGIVWVDLDGSSLRVVGGSDEELALVAALARSLNENLDEVVRVGFLVSGEPAETLAGHVDATRTYTGYEWPGPPPPASLLPPVPAPQAVP
ncbi:MAG: GerMN domain-containing protein [Acidobacteria bacterium]|nr:GerMN domain-containing protein [Acidobacteriota bacterium]MCU0254380.1 GerMN domain-containing protein [Acidobacteriota bacterium]